MSRSTAAKLHDRNMTPAAALHPTAPTTMAEAGLSQDLDHAADPEVPALRRRSDGHRSREPAGPGILGHRAVARLPEAFAPVRGLRRRRRWADRTRYRITDAGRRRALLFLEQSQYYGVAPVPLAQYRAYMNAYRNSRAAHRHARSRSRRRSRISCISDKVLDQVGPAIAAGHSMFVYGPPGNGKTVIAQAIRNLLDGEIAIPHAIEVEGQIIRLFDPVNHEPIAGRGQLDQPGCAATAATPAGCGAAVRW